MSTKEQSAIGKYMNWIVWFLRVDIAAGIIWMLTVGNWEAFLINILALVLTFAPNFVAKKYGIKLPLDYVLVIVVFLYMSMTLGSTFEAYEKFFWWDAVLHIASGVVISFAAYLMLLTMYQDDRVKATPFIIAMFTFSLGLALGGVWEIFEFTIDSFFGTNMQRSGLSDTMWDLIVDAIGSLFVAVLAYDGVKNKRKNGFMFDAAERYLNKNRKK